MLIGNIISALILGGLSSYLAKRRGKDPILWFVLGALFGILGLCFLYFSNKRPAKAKATAGAPLSDGNTIDIAPPYDPSYNQRFWYYLDKDNTRHGPMSFDALYRYYREMTIGCSTLVWNESLDGWQPIKDFISS